MNVLPFEKQVQVIAALTEGCSIRATERLTGANRNTIMSLGLRVGEGCARLHNRLMRDLQVNADRTGRTMGLHRQESRNASAKTIPMRWATCGCTWRLRPRRRP